MKTILEKLMVLPIMMICLASLQSCGKDIIGDKFGVLEVSPNSVSFDSSGGTAVIECVSNGFHIDHISDMKTGTLLYYYSSIDNAPDPEMIQLEGIIVKHEENKKDITITVSPSDVKREWNVRLLEGPFVADITATKGN